MRNLARALPLTTFDPADNTRGLLPTLYFLSGLWPRDVTEGTETHNISRSSKRDTRSVSHSRSMCVRAADASFSIRPGSRMRFYATFRR